MCSTLKLENTKTTISKSNLISQFVDLQLNRHAWQDCISKTIYFFANVKCFCYVYYLMYKIKTCRLSDRPSQLSTLHLFFKMHFTSSPIIVFQNLLYKFDNTVFILIMTNIAKGAFIIETLINLITILHTDKHLKCLPYFLFNTLICRFTIKYNS